MTKLIEIVSQNKALFSALGALVISEALPYVKNTEANGILQWLLGLLKKAPGATQPPGSSARAFLPFLVIGSMFVASCAHGPTPIDGPAVAQYRQRFTACIEAKGIQAAGTAGDDILKILESGGYTINQLVQQIEEAGIALAGGGIQDLAVCAVEAWFSDNPVLAGKATPSQAAARLYLLKHVPVGPGVHQ
jgi:hypothetical protein